MATLLLAALLSAVACWGASQSPAQAGGIIKENQIARRVVTVEDRKVVQVIVLVYSGEYFTGLRLREKEMRASNPAAGYVCFNAVRGGRAFIVKKDDKRVMRYSGYARQLSIAETYATQNNLQLQIVYVPMGAGSIRKEPRCRALLHP